MNGTVIKSWSSTQATTAQSSGEAEFYAVVRAAAEGLGIKTIMEDMGYEVEVRVHVDSSSAKSIASRTGLGKVRHMEVKFLWVQEAVRTLCEGFKFRGERERVPQLWFCDDGAFITPDLATLQLVMDTCWMVTRAAGLKSMIKGAPLLAHG